MARVLYISYDGMAEQLGQSQVLPYVHGLAARDYVFRELRFSFDLVNQLLIFERAFGERLRHNQP